MSEAAAAAGHSPRILLVVGGGIAAYKACELVRLIRKGANGIRGEVTCVVTKGGKQFVTPMSLRRGGFTMRLCADRFNLASRQPRLRWPRRGAMTAGCIVLGRVGRGLHGDGGTSTRLPQSNIASS